MLDLLPNNLSTVISRFRLRLRKNYSTYTLYMLHNFFFPHGTPAGSRLACLPVGRLEI